MSHLVGSYWYHEIALPAFPLAWVRALQSEVGGEHTVITRKLMMKVMISFAESNKGSDEVVAGRSTVIEGLLA